MPKVIFKQNEKISFNGHEVVSYQAETAYEMSEEQISKLESWGMEAAIVRDANEGADAGYLVGSGKQPAIFKLKDGSEMQLGTVVQRAYALSGVKNAREWNDLEQDMRELYIADAVKELDLADSGSDNTDPNAGEGSENAGDTEKKKGFLGGFFGKKEAESPEIAAANIAAAASEVQQ